MASTARTPWSPPVAICWRKTKRPAWSGACPAKWRRPGLPRRCCRLTRSVPSLIGFLRESARDPAGLRLSAPAAEGSLRPGARGREAVSRRKPPAAGCAPPWAELADRIDCQAEDAEFVARDRSGRGDDHQRNVLLPRQDP